MNKKVKRLSNIGNSFGIPGIVFLGFGLDKLRISSIIVKRCGVEQRQLVGLITRRSLVRIQSPLPEEASERAPLAHVGCEDGKS
jgi:hypothetical protein